MRIDDEDEGLRITNIFSFFGTNQEVFKLRLITYFCFEPFYSISLFADDNVDGLPGNHGHMSHTDGRTNTIVVFPFMAHNEDKVTRIDELMNSLGNNASPDARILFNGPGLAAKEMRRPVIFVDDSLVTAAA